MTQTEAAEFRAYVKAQGASPKQHVRDYYNYLQMLQVIAWSAAK